MTRCRAWSTPRRAPDYGAVRQSSGTATSPASIDAPYGNFKDLEGLTRAAGMACALGCDGKWAIHPDQIEGINQVFSPTDKEIQRARRILDADAKAQATGRGAVAVDGRMVDQATVHLAEKLWEQAKYLSLI